MKTITIFEKFVNAKEHISLEDMLNRIKQCIYSQWIKPLRRMLKEGNRQSYDSAKRTLHAFTPSGKFIGGRKREFLVEYSGVVVLDLDKLSEDDLPEIKAAITGCDYTMACFVSPSGIGLKVLVSVSTGAGEHLKAFLSVQRFYQSLTGVEIDPSGKDITRLCFVSMDADLYYNPGAEVFDPIAGSGQAWLSPKPKGPTGVGTLELDGEKVIGSKGILEIYRSCIAYVQRHCSFVEGQRNEFVFALALQLKKAGVPQELALVMLLTDYNYNEFEVRSCIKSAYGYNRSDEPQGGLPHGDNHLQIKSPIAEAPPPAKQRKRKPADPVSEENNTPGAIKNNSYALDSGEQLPPDPIPKKKMQKGAELYDLETVERMLRLCFETRYNDVTGLVEWRHAKTREPFKRMIDHDEHSMFRALHHADQKIPISTLHILLTSDFSRPYNPFVGYFRQLPKWNGVTDYIGQLTSTVRTNDDAYWAFCFRKWFVAYAASLVNDEVINHTVIVLIGAQGAGKTSWMKLLVPKALNNYLGTAALQTDSKDTSIQLSECALIILDELENLNRKDLAAFKELITRPEIRIRRPYGRNSENLPRRASFIASVNFEQVLTDPSGSRRYLCSKVEALDYKHTVDVDGAMAQAYALYKSGFKFWFDQEEIKELTNRNEDFMSKSVEEELIETWLRPVTLAEWKTKNQFVNSQNIQLMTATQVATKIMEKARITLLDNTIVKIGKILKKNGFERIRKGNNYSYMLRIVEAETVEMGCRTLDDTEAQKADQESNEQIIRFEEDLFRSSGDDKLPF